MKIKLDENLPADLATLLRKAGHDTRTVAEEGLAGHDDLPVLGAAVSERRILMTFDTDFADIRTYPTGTHAGIVVFRLREQRWKSLQGPARRLIAGRVLEKLGCGLAIVEEWRVRYRRPRC